MNAIALVVWIAEEPVGSLLRACASHFGILIKSQ
jgi:hypothetical protein